MKDVVIFDLDDTLFNTSHRRHYIDRPKSEQDWDGFYGACDRDVIVPDIARFWFLFQRDPACLYQLHIFTGRSDVVFDKTMRSLRDNDILLHPDNIRMRPAESREADHVLKIRWAKELGLERIWCVFEDRQSMVDAWRAHGVTCLQVAPGDF